MLANSSILVVVVIVVKPVIRDASTFDDELREW